MFLQGSLRNRNIKKNQDKELLFPSESSEITLPITPDTQLSQSIDRLYTPVPNLILPDMKNVSLLEKGNSKLSKNTLDTSNHTTPKVVYSETPQNKISPVRIILSKYQKIAYNSSKFRLIRYMRKLIKISPRINLCAVKYKNDNRSYYLVTRSVPNTNRNNYNIPAGHSEQRFVSIRDKFLKKHKLTAENFQYLVTEREPCGHGQGLKNCRCILDENGISSDKVFFAIEYPDGNDMCEKRTLSKTLNSRLASKKRKSRQLDFERKKFLSTSKSEDPSENDSYCIVDHEYNYTTEKK